MEKPRVTALSARNERARKTLQKEYSKGIPSLISDVHFLKKIGTVSVSHGGNFLKTKDSSTPPFPAPVSLQDDELDAIK